MFKLYAGLFAFVLLISGGLLGGAAHSSQVAISPGYAQPAVPGTTVTFTHILTNTGDVTDTFTVEAVSAHDWPVTVSGNSFPTGTIQLPLPLGAGMTTTVYVQLAVPDGMLSGTMTIILGMTDTVAVTATSLTTPTIFATTTDTATMVHSPWCIFLPLVHKNYPPPPTVKLSVDFGRILRQISDTELLQYDVPLAKDMGAQWVRVIVPWLEIEQTRGQYDWTPTDRIVTRLKEMHMKPLFTVFGAPSWAAVDSCGPMSDTAAFEGFLDVLIGRYGQDVSAWEFTNEPDGMYPYIWGASAGCWGLHPDLYAEQLGIFYRKIKAADPRDAVVFGGLAYDNWIDGHVARNFFTETLRYGAGQYFDIANVHYYPINPVEFPTMASKINEIRSTMERFGVRGKRIWVTETGMWVNLNGNVERQRYFIVQELTRGFSAGADNLFWFEVREVPTCDDCVHRWLISDDHQPINGYTTYQNMARRLAGAHYKAPYRAVPPGIEAYQFDAPDRSIYTLWGTTDVTQTVTIPASHDGIFTNRDGTISRTLPVQDGHLSLEVGLLPVFVEVNR